MWMEKHTKETIVCLVQFKGVDIIMGELPRIYIATPEEIGQKLKASRNGHGETILEKDIRKIYLRNGDFVRKG